MSENWKVQVSVKLPHDADNYRDTLINLRAETPEELDNLLAHVTGKAAEIGSAVQTIRGAATVGQAFAGPGTQTVANPVQHYQQAAAAPAPGQPYPPADVNGQPWQGQQAPQPTWSQQGTQQAAPAAASQGPAPQCVHGQMVYKSGVKNGKTWQGWMCPAPKGPGQCEPNWIR